MPGRADRRHQDQHDAAGPADARARRGRGDGAAVAGCRLDVVAARTAAHPVELLTSTLDDPDLPGALRALFGGPLREALAVASRDALAAVDAGDVSASLTRTLLRYLVRTTTRPTPFGLFAAVAAGTAADETRLHVPAGVRGVGTRPELPRSGRLHANPTAYESGDVLRYAEPGVGVVSTPLDERLRAGLAAADGCTAAELAGRVGAAYADALVSAGLVLDLPAVTTVPEPVPPPYEAAAPPLSVVAVRDRAGLTVGPDLARRVATAADDARRVTDSAVTPEVARFARAYADRWGERWLPLLEALDPLVGIAGALRSPVRTDQPYERRRTDLLLQALAGEASEVEAPPVDDPPPLPEAFGLTCRLDRDHRVLVRFAHASGTRVLGRFAHAEPALAQAIRAHHDREAARHPGALLAEIAHLPSARAAPVVGRPALRAAEIVLFAAPGAACAVRPADLLVGVVDGEVQLRLADGTRVLPRLASAHDPRGDPLLLYRFLAALQGAGLGWSWGGLADAPYLPRVRSGGTLLSLRTWNLAGPAPVDEIRPRLPRWVAVVGADDEELVLDLERAACRDLLAHELRRGRRRLREVWPVPDESPFTGPAGTYAGELVVACTQSGPPVRQRSVAMTVGRGTRHLPGGSWLSLEVPCAPAAADALLLVARPLLAGRDWFFLRYADPGHHLRLRVRDGLDLLGAFHDLLAPRDDVGLVRITTYEPEVERYGGTDHIATAEQVFAADSRALLDVLPVPEGERWRLTVAAVDAMWGTAPLARLEAVRDAGAREQRFTAERRREIGRRFRAERAALETVRHPVLDRRARELAPLLATLPDHVLPSLAHLTVNRWVRSGQREQEAVVHDVLVRLRRSREARR